MDLVFDIIDLYVDIIVLYILNFKDIYEFEYDFGSKKIYQDLNNNNIKIINYCKFGIDKDKDEKNFYYANMDKKDIEKIGYIITYTDWVNVCEKYKVFIVPYPSLDVNEKLVFISDIIYLPYKEKILHISINELIHKYNDDFFEYIKDLKNKKCPHYKNLIRKMIFQEGYKKLENKLKGYNEKTKS